MTAAPSRCACRQRWGGWQLGQPAVPTSGRAGPTTLGALRSRCPGAAPCQAQRSSKRTDGMGCVPHSACFSSSARAPWLPWLSCGAWRVAGAAAAAGAGRHANATASASSSASAPLRRRFPGCGRCIICCGGMVVCCCCCTLASVVQDLWRTEQRQRRRQLSPAGGQQHWRAALTPRPVTIRVLITRLQGRAVQQRRRAPRPPKPAHGREAPPSWRSNGSPRQGDVTGCPIRQAGPTGLACLARTPPAFPVSFDDAIR